MAIKLKDYPKKVLTLHPINYPGLATVFLIIPLMRTLHLSLIASAIVTIIVFYRFIKASKETHEKFDALSLLVPTIISIFASLGVAIVLAFFSSNVTIVYEKDGSWQHDGARYLAHYSYNNDGINVSFPAKWCGNSLYNASDKTVVLHPVIYGNIKASKKEQQTYTILPHEYVRIPDFPSYFFSSVPGIAYSKGSGKIKWVLLEEGEEVREQVNYLRIK